MEEGDIQTKDLDDSPDVLREPPKVNSDLFESWNQDVETLGKGDLQPQSIIPKEQNSLSKEEQMKIANEEEIKRQKKFARVNPMNNAVGPVNAIKALKNHKEIRELLNTIKTIKKETKEVGSQIKKESKELKKLKKRVTAQIIRMIIETVSVVGIVGVIGEAMTMSMKNSEIMTKNRKIKELKGKLKTNQQRTEQIQKQIYNLQTIFQIETDQRPAANSPDQDLSSQAA